MPGTYVVNYSDPSKPPIQIPPLGADGSTSMRMVGYRAPVYGEMLWENFLHLLEQFASSVPPANPTSGQIWANTATNPAKLYVYDPRVVTDTTYYQWHLLDTAQIQYASTPPANGELLWCDSTTSTLRYFNGSSWDALTTLSGATPPTNPYVCQLWHDTVTNVLRYWTGSAWAPITTISSAVPPPTPRRGDLWEDTATNTLRYWDGSSWDVLTNIASDSPPSSAYNGQLWLNTSTSPPEMFYRDSSAVTVSDLPGWHRTSAGVHIGTNPPEWNEGIWYNPTTGALNLYVSGAWKNILVTNFAGVCDYNNMVVDVNSELARINEPPIPQASGSSVGASEWNALFDKVRLLATFWNIPYPKPIDIKNLGTNLGRYAIDDKCGIYSIRRRLRLVEQALCKVGGSVNVNPECYDEHPVASTVVSTTAWNKYVHTLTVTFATEAAATEYFQLGGYITWTGSLDAPENPVNDAWEGVLTALSGLEIKSNRTIFSGQRSPLGVQNLSSTEQLLLMASAPTRETAVAELYGKREGAVITLRLILTEHVSSAGVTGALLSSFNSVRVGSPCKPTPPEFPQLAGAGEGTLPTPTYAITPSVTKVTEGGSVLFTVTTTNVPADTVLKWATGMGGELGGGITSSDFADDTFSGTVTIDASGIGTFTRNIATDLETEGTERFFIVLYAVEDTNMANELAASVPITIEDVVTPASLTLDVQHQFDSAAPKVGDKGVVTVTITNTGGAKYTGPSASVTISPDFTIGYSGISGSLYGYSTQTWTYNVTINAAGSITTTATIGNLSAEATTVAAGSSSGGGSEGGGTTGPAALTLWVHNTFGAFPQVGSKGQVSVTVVNTGGAYLGPEPNITMPAGFSITNRATSGNLGANNTLEITFDVTAIATGEQKVVATIEGLYGSDTTMIYAASQQNSPPTAVNIQSLPIVTVGVPTTIDFSGLFSDPDGKSDIVSYTATGLHVGLTMDPATGIVTGAPTRRNVVTSLRVTATDSRGQSVSTNEIDWRVNQPPVIKSNFPSLVTSGTGDMYVIYGNLNAYFEDPDGDMLSFTVTGLPDGIELNPPNTALGTIQGNPAATTPGDYQVTVVATDGAKGSYATGTCTWRVVEG